MSPGRHHTPLPSSAPCPSHCRAFQTPQTALDHPQMPRTCPAPATRQEAGRGFGDAERSSGNLSSTPPPLHCPETCSHKYGLVLRKHYHIMSNVVRQHCNRCISKVKQLERSRCCMEVCIQQRYMMQSSQISGSETTCLPRCQYE